MFVGWSWCDIWLCVWWWHDDGWCVCIPLGSLNDGRLGDDLGVGLGYSCITTCVGGMVRLIGGVIVGLDSNDGGNECGGLGRD